MRFKLDMNSKMLAAVALVCGAGIIGLTQVSAGNLTPPTGALSPTMLTLADLSNSLTSQASQAMQVPKSWVGPMAITELSADTQGQVRGSDTVGTFADAIQIYAYGHEVDAPRTASTGLPTGKRQHKPITITKGIDQTSPLLMSAMVANENLSTVTFRMFMPVNTGVINHFTVELTNALVANIRHDTVGVGGSTDPAMREHVMFDYQTITWTWESTGVTTSDTWVN